MKRLLLFARRPLLGAVKTRLAPPLEPRQALRLYRAFLADQLAFLRSFENECEVELWLDRPWPTERGFTALCAGLRRRAQGPGDLGCRMLRAFRSAEREGASATVVLGADTPTLPASRVRDAFRRLSRGADLAVAPARDGGYVLLGLSRPVATLFRKVPWGGPAVLAITLDRAASAGLVPALLPAWHDVDTSDDLERLRRELALPGGRRRAPRTARLLELVDWARNSVV